MLDQNRTHEPALMIQSLTRPVATNGLATREVLEKLLWVTAPRASCTPENLDNKRKLILNANRVKVGQVDMLDKLLVVLIQQIHSSNLPETSRLANQSLDLASKQLTKTIPR